MSVPAAFAGVILIWSTTPLAIQWSSEGGGFLFGVTARMTLGLVFCVLAIRFSGLSMPWHRRARGTYVAAGLGIYGSMHGDRTDLGVAAVLLSTVVHAASAVWVRRLSAGLPALAVTGGGLMLAVPLFILTWMLFDGGWPSALPERAGFSIVYLAMFGSLLGFLWYFYLLREVEAARVNLVTLVTPVTALLLGHWLNDEVIDARVWFGTALILGGLLIHQWDQFSRRAVAD